MNSSEKAASPTRARCISKRKDGEPCQAYGVENGLCLTHAGKGFSRETATQAAKIKAQRAQARRVAQQESLKDKLARQLEARSDLITSRLAEIVEHGTHADSLRAIEAWLSRVYGKPTERLEVQEQGEDVADLSLTELLAERDRMMQLEPYKGSQENTQ